MSVSNSSLSPLVKLGAAVGDDFALVAIRSGTNGGTFGPWSGAIAAADPVGAGIGAGSFGRAFAGTAALVVSWGPPRWTAAPRLADSCPRAGPAAFAPLWPWAANLVAVAAALPSCHLAERRKGDHVARGAAGVDGWAWGTAATTSGGRRTWLCRGTSGWPPGPAPPPALIYLYSMCCCLRSLT